MEASNLLALNRGVKKVPSNRAHFLRLTWPEGSDCAQSVSPRIRSFSFTARRAEKFGLKASGKRGAERRAGVRSPRRVWPWWSKPMVSHFGVGVFTTHFRPYFSGDWDVHWGYGLLTHGHMDSAFLGDGLPMRRPQKETTTIWCVVSCLRF